MSMETDGKKLPLEELTGVSGEQPVPDYSAWKDEKVRKAQQQALDRSKMIPAHKVWETFGFER